MCDHIQERENDDIEIVVHRTHAGIHWDYTPSHINYAWRVPGYYHIFCAGGPWESKGWHGLDLDVPETPENDADVQIIVEAFARIVMRHP